HVSSSAGGAVPEPTKSSPPPPQEQRAHPTTGQPTPPPRPTAPVGDPDRTAPCYPAEVPATDAADDPKFGEYIYIQVDPEAIEKAWPEYPDDARRRGVDGIVMVQAQVRRDGTVGRVCIVKSIPPLDAAAAACVRRWRFKPATVEGNPVAVWVGVPVKFSLH